MGKNDPANIIKILNGRMSSVRANITTVCVRSGRNTHDVKILAATKSIPPVGMRILAEAGIILVGENRTDDLESKYDIYKKLFTWHFIGQLQSRKVKQILSMVELIHSVDSLSVVKEIDRWALSPQNVLLQVNLSREASKGGVMPEEVEKFLDNASSCPKANFIGLMTMPPLADNPEKLKKNRRIFTQLRKLADTHCFTQLSMGTSQDYLVAVEEGATIVRIGEVLFNGLFQN